MQIVDALIGEAVEEIRLRDPGFLERQPVAVPSLEALAGAYAAQPPFDVWGPKGVASRLEAGLARAAELGVRIVRDGDSQPLLARMLADSVIDAEAAGEGLIPLRPAPRAQSLETALGEDYVRNTAEGVDYIVRKRGARWLLLVNAIGIPLSAWSRLIADAEHDFRILVVDSGCSDPLQGGMRSDSGLDAEVARIRTVLAAEDATDVTVVGWCSGGRVAVDLAVREPERVGRLMLVATTFRGSMADEPAPTQFEMDVGGVFSAVSKTPGSADFLSKMLVQSQSLAAVAAEDSLLFRLPDRARAKELTAPFATGEQLRAYASRIVSDRGHPTGEAFAQLRAPILVVAGAHDQVIDNAAMLQAVRTSASKVTAVAVGGAGHYVHDLQYPYLRMLLEDAAAGRPPTLCARVTPLAL